MPHECQFEDKIDGMDKKLDTMVEAMVGTVDGTKRGFNFRVSLLEKWKRIEAKVLLSLSVLVIGSILLWRLGI